MSGARATARKPLLPFIKLSNLGRQLFLSMVHRKAELDYSADFCRSLSASYWGRSLRTTRERWSKRLPRRMTQGFAQKKDFSNGLPSCGLSQNFFPSCGTFSLRICSIAAMQTLSTVYCERFVRRTDTHCCVEIVVTPTSIGSAEGRNGQSNCWTGSFSVVTLPSRSLSHARFCVDEERWIAGILGLLARYSARPAKEAPLDVSASRQHDREADLQASADKIGGHLFSASIRIHVWSKSRETSLQPDSRDCRVVRGIHQVAQAAPEDADDERLGLFLSEYADGHTAPEPFASCQGGVDETGGVTTSV